MDSEISKETNVKSIWFIAAIFFVTGGLIAPFTTGFILQLLVPVMVFINEEYNIPAGYISIATFVVSYLSITWTTYEVAKIVTKKYVKVSTRKVSLVATGYFFLITCCWAVFTWIQSLNEMGVDGGAFQFLIIFKILTLGFFAFVLYKSINRFYI